MREHLKKEDLGKIVEILDGNTPIIAKVVALHNDNLVISTKIDIFEPEIKAGLNISQKEQLSCLYEKSCGTVLFTRHQGEVKFLLIKNGSGHIGFPKGHIELNETESQTACREAVEETGIKPNLYDDFRMEYRFETLENTYKTCVYFMSEYEYREPDIQESEILHSWLVGYDEAMTLLNFVQDREILVQVNKRIISND